MLEAVGNDLGNNQRNGHQRVEVKAKRPYFHSQFNVWGITRFYKIRAEILDILTQRQVNRRRIVKPAMNACHKIKTTLSSLQRDRSGAIPFQRPSPAKQETGNNLQIVRHSVL